MLKMETPQNKKEVIDFSETALPQKCYLNTSLNKLKAF